MVKAEKLPDGSFFDRWRVMNLGLLAIDLDLRLIALHAAGNVDLLTSLLHGDARGQTHAVDGDVGDDLASLGIVLAAVLALRAAALEVHALGHRHDESRPIELRFIRARVVPGLARVPLARLREVRL